MFIPFITWVLYFLDWPHLFHLDAILSAIVLLISFLDCSLLSSRNITRDFPGGPVVRNPPAKQVTRVRFLVWEDPTCHGATKPMGHNYWACTLEPSSHNKRSRHNEKSTHCSKEEPPLTTTRERAQQWRPSTAKKRLINLNKKRSWSLCLPVAQTWVTLFFWEVCLRILCLLGVCHAAPGMGSAQGGLCDTWCLTLSGQGLLCRWHRWGSEEQSLGQDLGAGRRFGAASEEAGSAPE